MPYGLRDENIERLLRQQAALVAFGIYACREPVVLDLLNEAARICAEALDAPLCTVCRYREAENDLLIEAGYGWTPGAVGQAVAKVDATSPQGRAFAAARPVILESLHEADALLLPAFYGEHGITSTLGVTIKATDSEPYGVLEIGSPTRRTYDEHEAGFLAGFATLLAEAIATAARSEALRRRIARTQARAAEGDRLLAERTALSDALKRRARNDLQLVQGMLASHERSDPGTGGEASVNGIVRRTAALAEVYEQLLGTGMDRTINLGEYLRSLCTSLPGLQREQNSRIELVCTVEPLFVGLDTAAALGMAVAEAVSNRCEHALRATGGVINVLLQRSRTADEALVAVHDNGAGFFEQPGSERHRMRMVRRLIEQVHGIAELRSGRGTAWAFRFPVETPAAEPTAAARS